MMLKKLKHYLLGSIRRQLILSVALVHAVLMSLFIYDLTHRQADLLLERQTEQAQALARSVATSAAGWVASRDYYGLQEIISTQSQYPELEFAMILDQNKKIIAHSDTRKIGFYVDDMQTLRRESIIRHSSELVDVASPIILADRIIGWARIGLSQANASQKIHAILINGSLYALAAILIGSFFAWYTGKRMTRALQQIHHTAAQAEAGALEHRVTVHGEDELAAVAQALNSMLDAFQDSQQQLKDSEERFNLAISATNDGLYDWDLNSGRVYYSPRWMSMVGYAENELAHDLGSWEKLVDADDRVATMKQVQAMLDGKSDSFEVEFRMRHKQGHWVHILSRGALIRDKSGKPQRIIGTHVDITEKKQKDQTIWQQANYDVLTGLPNRKLFLELLQRQVKRADRYHSSIWLFFIDLDGFKSINDTHGHQAGDQLLVQVGQRLQATVRDADIVARLSGDEFVVALTDSSHNQYNVDRFAEKLNEQLAAEFELDSTQVYISASIGISNYPRDAKNADELLKFSDQSMYLAKRQGKNRYTYFTPELEQAAQQRSQIATDLRTALLEQQFELNFQPVFNLKTGMVQKAEALLRWNHPLKGRISPEEFIPVAEESGLICDIGLWIFDTVFATMQRWKKDFNSELGISINMSPIQLRVADEKYDEWLERIEKIGLWGSQIVIEITESMLIRDENTVNQRLLKYRDHGIEVAIDDFGTGYSSLSYLKEFDIDYLKIDQSFVRNLEPGNQEESLCEAIIVMAHKLGIWVIAEGIETPQQKAMLQHMQCNYGQGYLFSKPLSTAQFEQTYLTSSKTANSA